MNLSRIVCHHLARALTCSLLVTHALTESVSPHNGHLREHFIADRNIDDETLSHQHGICNYGCAKIESFRDLDLLINKKLMQSYGAKVKISICPSYRPITWPPEKSIIFDEEIDLTIECCGQSCIIDGGLRTGDEMRTFALFNFRNASRVEVKQMKFQNVPRATNSSGSVLQFESGSDLLVSGSTFKRIRSENGAINNRDSPNGIVTGLVTLEDSTFFDNYASNDGGVMRASGIVRMIGNVFRGCRADDDGGSVYIFDGKVDSEQNHFEDSSAGDNGGAVYVNSNDSVFKGDVFKNCSAEDDGGAIFSNRGKTDILSSQFIECNAGDQGGAVDLASGSFLSEFNRYTGNKAGRGGALFQDNGVLKSSGDVFKENIADDGDDVGLRESVFFYCQAKFSKEISIAKDTESISERMCGKEIYLNDCVRPCSIVKTFPDFKKLIEDQLDKSSGSSVQLDMCANDEPIIWPNNERFRFVDKIDFKLNCCGGTCSFDGSSTAGDVREDPPFDFFSASKVSVNQMEFKNFAGPEFYGGSIFVFFSVVAGSIANSKFENILAQYGSIFAETGTLKLAKNTFLNNNAFIAGSAAYLQRGTLEITENVVTGNRNPVAFGAMVIDVGFAHSQRNQYIDNSSPVGGSALSMVSGHMRSTQDLFYNNSDAALFMFRGVAEVHSSLFAKNSAAAGGAFQGGFVNTYISRENKYRNNMAVSIGGAIAGDVLATVSKNDIFYKNVATGENSITSASFDTNVTIFADLFHAKNASADETEDEVEEMSRLSSSQKNMITKLQGASSFGDDVFVEDGSVFFFCASIFSGRDSVTGEVGGTALIAEKCDGYAQSD